MSDWLAVFRSIFGSGDMFVKFLFSVARISTTYTFIAIAAVICEKAGVSNMMAESMMTASAFAGVVIGGLSHSLFVGIIAGMLFSIITTLIMCYASFVLKVDMYLMSISLNMALPAATIFLMYIIYDVKSTTAGLVDSPVMPDIQIPILKDIPVLGDVLSGHNGFTYLAWFSVFFCWFLLRKTKFGLRMNAFSQNPEVGVTLGLSREKVYTISFVVSSCFASLAGTYLSMGYLQYYLRGMTGGRGFIGMSAANIAGGNPVISFIIAIIYSAAEAFSNYAKEHIDQAQLVAALPYIISLILLIINSYIKTVRNKAKRNRVVKKALAQIEAERQANAE